ncbi:MCE family protein [bacterium]|nr:MCE family protein [bacterium]
MKGISTEAKVGLLVLLAIFILAFLTLRAGNYEFNKKNGYRLTVVFDSVAGLDQKARVKVSGVDAGYVEEISLVDDGARLTLRIKEGINIRKNAQARILSLGLMGEKYIEIEPGTEEFPLLRNGETISTGLAGKSLDQLGEQIGALADDLMAITKSIKAVIATQEGQARLTQIMENMEHLTTGMSNIVIENQKEINRIVKNLADFSGELNKLMVQNKGHVSNIVSDLNVFSSDLALQGKKMMQDMGDVTESLKSLVDPNNKDIGSTFKRLAGVTEKLDLTLKEVHEIAERMNKGEGTIGKLLTDEKVYNEISGTLEGLNTTLSKADAFSLHLGFRSEYLTEYEKSKSYFSLKIQPRENKYYMLEFVDGFKERVSSTRRVFQDGTVVSVEEETQDKLLFSLLMAYKLGPFFLKGGLMESEGGAGIDYYPFGENFCLGVEGWDFDQTKPHLKIFSKLIFKRYFHVNIGWDDAINSDAQSFFAGAGFAFEDKDLKYILTKLPLPGL